MGMQNYAKFESNIVSDRGLDESMKYGITSLNGNSGGILDSGMDIILSIALGIILIITTIFFIFLSFFILYIIISLISKGGEKTLEEIKKVFLWFYSAGNKVFGIVFSKIKNILLFLWKKKKTSISIILILVFINFSGNVINGKSKILKLSKINSGFVGVDLKNDKILVPGYHLYSPIKTSYFLSPTNNFDFEIVEITANTKEELSVSLDYKVGFKIDNNKRLEFYKTYGSKSIKKVSSDIVMPKLLEVIKGTIRNYGFKDISTKHGEIKKITLKQANEILIPLGIELKDITILDIRLPKSYLISKEDLLKAENELKLAEAKLEAQKKESEKQVLQAQNSKKVKIIEAESVAEYNKIINNINLSKEAIEIKKLELEKLKIEKWDGKIPTNIGGNFEL